jgi:hypothetical protein
VETTICSLIHLKELRLNYTKITDQSLEKICSALRCLQTLDVSACQNLSNIGLNAILTLPRLIFVNISKLSGDHVDVHAFLLSRQDSLADVNLSGISGVDEAYLSCARDIVKRRAGNFLLKFESAKISNEVLEKLFELVKSTDEVEEIEIIGSELVSERVLEMIRKKFKYLKRLKIQECKEI